ncbi:hypothetical protein [Streptomyces sp. 769]|uniref:hypothetical protein n=1 Tax=Streptomyces sp. 769 TaxID=1262452 RepID=UPI000581F24B|nr:hypothetical protein [Streptomyces sp. 769]AJC53977.1 hypothetical protein GZL_01377 [Streptomyces sp. 769]
MANGDTVTVAGNTWQEVGAQFNALIGVAPLMLDTIAQSDAAYSLGNLGATTITNK